MPNAVDQFSNQATEPTAISATGPLNGPLVDAAAVTPSDTVDLTYVTRAIYVGVAGDVTLITLGTLTDPVAGTRTPTTVTFKAVPAGFTLWVRATRIKATNTSATNILALW